MLNLFVSFRYWPAMLMLLTCSFAGFSQHYPVQVNTIISPPYSARLSDYAETSFDRIQIIVNPLDMNLESYKVKIKLIIESLDGRIRIHTDPGFLPPPLYLNGGVTEIVTSFDIQSLFDARNLVFQKGITRNEYLVNKKLPENYYRIGFVLLDYNRSTLGGNANEIPVSNFGYVQAGIFLNDPPILNFPGNNTKLKLFEPQNIMLQWTPRHRGSPNSAFSAEYVIRLYEVWNDSYSAAAIVQTQMPVFETVTSDNRYIYGMADPLLIPGRKYVWTVQARDADGRDMFRNNGISEAYMFTWGEACKIPENIKAVPVNGPGIELQWNTSTGHTDYNIQYKTAGNSDWYEENSLLNNARIYKLSHSTTYETRVRANCGTYYSEYSQPVKIKMPEEPVQNFNCGSAGTTPPVSSTTPLFALSSGALFYAGGFECHVEDAVAENGGFSGTCYVVVPFYGFAKVLHTFRNIRINTDLQMFSGTLTSVADTVKGNALTSRINEALQPKGSGYSNDQLEQLLGADSVVVVDGRIRSVTFNDRGEVVITFQNGKEEVMEYEEGKKLIITGKDGEQYVVHNGSVVKANEALAEKTTDATKKQEVANAEDTRSLLPLVHFAPATGMKYGFDSLQYPALQAQYTRNIVHGTEYILPFKAVETGGIDIIEARMPVMGELDASGLSFKINGTLTTTNPSGQNTRNVNVTSLLHGDEQVLEAVYVLKDTSGREIEESLGQVNIVAYDKEIIKLKIVPVGKSVGYNQQGISDFVNNIYSQSVVQWDIQWTDPFESGAWKINDDEIFDDTDKDNRMDYTPAMKALIKDYNAGNDIEKHAVYVFLFNGEHATEGLEGYMPLNKQFAFVFTRGVNDDKTLAHNISHEIAHGTFNLRHTFSDENPYFQSMGTTDNLMDYSTSDATFLNKYQWDLIHDPASVMFGWLEEEGEGEMSLPCVGWFDDCDDVLKILETFRNARIKGNQVKIKGQTKIEERTLIAKSVKIGETDYNKIRLIYTPKKTDFTFNPVKYDYYDQQFFLGDGSIDRQRGFVYYKDSKELFKIIVDDEAGTIGKLKDYLFGKEYDEIVQILENKTVLTASEIKDVREQIAMLRDEDQKKELYLKLQEKVSYHSQRDNVSPATEEDIANNSWMTTYNVSTAGDIMCNLTTQAMCLEYLGISPPCNGCSANCNSYDQFEDYMECVRVDKGLDHRGETGTRKDLAELFDNVSYIFVNLATYEKAIIESKLKTSLEDGCSVLISAFGHIVRLQGITKDGLVVDDPYGKVVDFSKSGCSAKYKNDGKDYRNGKDFTDKEGDNNIWKWTDLSSNNVKINYAEIYCSK